MTQRKRVLPADIYDALELSAEAYGGIGACRERDWLSGGTPYCVMGHARELHLSVYGELQAVLGGPRPMNDMAVVAINRAAGRPARDRVPFQVWAEKLHVVRGEA